MRQAWLVGLGLTVVWACGGKTLVEGAGAGGTAAQSSTGLICADPDPGLCPDGSAFSSSTVVSASTGASSVAATTAAASSSSGGMSCNPACTMGFTCCNGACVNENN